MTREIRKKVLQQSQQHQRNTTQIDQRSQNKINGRVFIATGSTITTRYYLVVQ